MTINVDRRFEELFFGFKDSLIALGARFAIPVLRALMLLFSWLYVSLDLSNLMDWMFQLVPDAELTCQGTQQPMYLFSNLVLYVCIMWLASADVQGPFRFRQRWDTLIAARDGGWPSPIAVFGEKLENLFVYVLRALAMLVTSRPLMLGNYTAFCKDRSITIITFLLAFPLSVIMFPILISSFVPSVGPAPPLRLDRLAPADDGEGFEKSAREVALAEADGTSIGAGAGGSAGISLNERMPGMAILRGRQLGGVGGATRLRSVVGEASARLLRARAPRASRYSLRAETL